MKRLLIVLVLLEMALPAAGAAEPGAEMIANVLKRTRSHAARAVALVKAAKLVTDDRAAMVAILDKAVLYGLKAGRVPEAMKATAEALDLLEAKAPDRLGEWHDKRLAAARLAFRYAQRQQKATAGRELIDVLVGRAEELAAAGQWEKVVLLYREGQGVARAIRSPLQEWLRFQAFRGQHFQSIAGRIEVEKRKLSGATSDPGAREKALELLAVEMGDFPAAKALLTPDVDQTWRSYVPLAMRDPSALDETAATELGRWYHQFLVPKASKFAEMRILIAARSCYQRAVVLHEAKDAALVTLRLRLAEVEKQLEEIVMDPTAGGRGADVDLLRSLDLDATDWKGAWGLVKGGLTVWPREAGYLRVPAVVTGSYRLHVEVGNRFNIPVKDTYEQFRRIKGPRQLKKWLVRSKPGTKRGVDLAFPVGEKHLCLTLEPGRTDTRAKLWIIESDPDDKEIPAGFQPLGEYVAKDETLVAEGSAFPTERLHRLDVAVFVKHGVAAVTIHLNDQPLFRWRGKAERCYLTEQWPLGKFRGQIFLGGWTGPSVFAAAKVCTFDGHVRFLPYVQE